MPQADILLTMQLQRSICNVISIYKNKFYYKLFILTLFLILLSKFYFTLLITFLMLFLHFESLFTISNIIFAFIILNLPEIKAIIDSRWLCRLNIMFAICVNKFICHKTLCYWFTMALPSLGYYSESATTCICPT